MSSTLIEALRTRQCRAAEAAAAAAEQLSDIGDRDEDAQYELEIALNDLERYANLKGRLDPIAGEYGIYRREGHSILRDAWAARNGDTNAARRLNDHARAENPDLERRDLGASSVFASVPDWVLSGPGSAPPSSTNSSPFLDVVGRELQPGVTNIDLVGWGTEPTAAAQAGMNAALSTGASSLADTTVAPVVKTFGTRAALSIQLLEMTQDNGTLDSIILPQMIAATSASIDASMINGSGTSGALLGLLNIGSISTSTYVDASPTLGEGWPSIAAGVRLVEAQGRAGNSLLLMHGRRLSWLTQHAVTELIPAFDFDAPTVPGATCSIFGGTLNLIADNNIPTTLGGGTEDTIVALRGPDVVDAFVGRPRLSIGDVAAGKAYVQVWREVAFTSRLAAGICAITGSGLAAPTP